MGYSANVAFTSLRYDGGMPTRFLVCPPTKKAIVHNVNPWLRSKVVSAAPNARRQWDRFIETLHCVGDVSIVEVEAQEKGPDLVFPGNAALISGNLAVLSSCRHPERRREQSIFRTALARAGLVTTCLRQTYFEGASDTLFDRVRPLCYAGYRLRAERSATMELQELVGCRVLPLLLLDERFFHLDTVLCPLGSGHVMAYLAAFSPHAQTLLRRAIEPDYLIEVGLEDALAFACNAVEVGDALVVHITSSRLRERLNDAGYRVFGTDLDEFTSAGGSAKTLTLRLDDGPVA